ncbi:MAG TPA: aspartate kinase [Terriglobales bacterium]|nr:aspartate kinase [Terriglobales bacterium]
MIVLKFGGSSLESAEAIERVARIVRSRIARHPAVIVSAHGKATDNLLALAKDAAEGHHAPSVERFNALESYHSALAAAVVADHDRKALDSFLNAHFHELFNAVERLRGSGKLSEQGLAEITSFGERLSSGIMALALRKAGIETAHLDARVLVRTNDCYTNATPVLDESCARIRRAIFSLDSQTIPVLGGFIGSTPTGVTTTLGRNSSNLSAVLVGAAVDAEEVEIWTDVDGVYAHDPRLVTDQSPVETLSFEDAATMAAHGAKVFHHGAVMLAQQENIPIWIKNSRNPQARGTKVCAQNAIASKASAKQFFPQAAAAESGVA